MDGTTSIWSIKGRNCTRTVRNESGMVLAMGLVKNRLLQTSKNRFSGLDPGGQFTTLSEDMFTITKFITCNGCVYGIDKTTPHILRCFSSSTLVGSAPSQSYYYTVTVLLRKVMITSLHYLRSQVHLPESDITNTMDEEKNTGFYQVTGYSNTHLVLATR